MWFNGFHRPPPNGSNMQSPPVMSSRNPPPHNSSIPPTASAVYSSNPPGAAASSLVFRRLQKERLSLTQSPLDCIRFIREESQKPQPTTGASSSTTSFAAPTPPPVAEWLIEIKGATGTLYEGEAYNLRFRFPESYPMESPEVLFDGSSPVHPHVYSNGHICVSILYDEWSPALGVVPVCISLISMLSSSKNKERPPDDARYTMMCGNRVSPKRMKWNFHDDKA